MDITLENISQEEALEIADALHRKADQLTLMGRDDRAETLYEKSEALYEALQ